MRIQNNIMAMNTHRMYTTNNNSVSKAAEKLSSGYRINRAGDDAAGLAISEKMRAQIRGLNMATKNSQDAVSMVQTAEGALQEVHTMLQRMNELSVQAASDSNDTSVDRAALQKEFSNLQDEIDQIASTTKFNNMALLDGEGGAVGAAAAATGGGITATAAGSVTAGNATTKAAFTVDLAGLSIVSEDGGSFNLAFGTAGALGSVSAQLDGSATAQGPGVAGQALAAKYGVGSGNVAIIDGRGYTIASTAAGVLTFTATENGPAPTTSDATTELGTAGTFVQDKVSSWKIQVGAEQNQSLEIGIKAMNTTGLKITKATATELAGTAAVGTGVLGNVSIHNRDSASNAITRTRDAINTVSSQRAQLGALQNRLDHKIANLENTSENLSAAESRIRDVDMAKEMTTFTKQNILSQAATAMLAQANAAPQGVLSLLQ